MVYLLHATSARRPEERRCCWSAIRDPDKPRILGVQREDAGLASSSMVPLLHDRTGSTTSRRSPNRASNPLARSCRFMLIEEPPHVRGRMGVQRIVQRTCDLMKGTRPTT